MPKEPKDLKDTEMAEVFFRAFKTLDKKNKLAFYERLLKVREFRKELIALAIAEWKAEPHKPLSESLAERKKKVFSGIKAE